eukprot:gene7858-biopygen6086
MWHRGRNDNTTQQTHRAHAGRTPRDRSGYTPNTYRDIYPNTTAKDTLSQQTGARMGKAMASGAAQRVITPQRVHAVHMTHDGRARTLCRLRRVVIPTLWWIVCVLDPGSQVLPHSAAPCQPAASAGPRGRQFSHSARSMLRME